MSKATVDYCVYSLITYQTLQEIMSIKRFDTLNGAIVYGRNIKDSLETIVKCQQRSHILILKQFGKNLEGILLTNKKITI
jgi:hypothetical protein